MMQFKSWQKGRESQLHNCYFDGLSSKTSVRESLFFFELSLYTHSHSKAVLPKSETAERIAENATIFDFQLTDSEMNVLTAMDKGRHYAWDPTGKNPKACSTSIQDWTLLKKKNKESHENVIALM